ncbi:MAG: putative Ig domain-containing protein [Pseudomonadota bacterium]
MEDEIDGLGTASLRFAAGDPGLFAAEEGASLGALESASPSEIIYLTANQTGPLADLRYVLESTSADFGGSSEAGFTGTITGLSVFDGPVGDGALLYSVADFALPLAQLFDGSLPGGADAVDLALFSGVNRITAVGPEIDTAALANTRLAGETDVVVGAEREDTAIVAGLAADFVATGAVESFLLEGLSTPFLAQFDSIEVIRFDDGEVSVEALLGLDNAPPQVDVPISDQDATVGAAFEFTLPPGTFSDPDGDALSVVASTPGWLAFDAGTGLFSGTPAEADVGAATVTVTASDGELTALDSFEITVMAAPVENQAPVVANPVADQSAIVGTGFTLILPGDVFSDPDGDDLTLSANPPDWLVFDPATRVLTGTPGEGDIGTATVTVTASDGEFTADEVFEIVIEAEAINQAPVVDVPVLDQSATAGTPFSLTLPGETFSDPDGDALSLTAVTPAWLMFDAATGVFSGTPAETDVGTAAVTVTASDGALTVDDSFDIAVAAAPIENQAPVLDVPLLDQMATVGAEFSLTIPPDTFSDPDEDALTLSASLPDWLSFDPATAVLSGTPLAEDLGTATVTISATDGEFAITDAFDILVEAEPIASIIVTTALDIVDAEDGLTSLREAVTEVNAGSGTEPELITFDPSLAGERFTLTGGEIAISNAVVIDGTGVQPIISGDAAGDDVLTGAGLTDLVTTRSTLGDAALLNNSRIFGTTADVTFRAVTLTGGVAPLVSFENPETEESFASAFGGAINSLGTLTIEDSLIAGNLASTRLGRSDILSDDETADGGAILSTGDLTISNSTLSDNEVEALGQARGGGVFVQAFDADGGALTLLADSQITGNRAVSDILAQGGGAAVAPGTLDIQSGAITGNVAITDFVSVEDNTLVEPPAAPATSPPGESFVGGGGGTILGTMGTDTVTYAHARAEVALAADANMVTVTLADDTVDVLAGIERVVLTDGSWLLGLAHEADTVYRLFVAAFGRAPDEDGLRFWEDARADGMDAEALAESFVASPEFAARFGGPDPADALYVTELYDNVLGRGGDPDGAAFWEGQLAAGDSRAEVLLAFAESPENLAGTAEDTEPGLWVLG